VCAIRSLNRLRSGSVDSAEITVRQLRLSILIDRIGFDAINVTLTSIVRL